MNELLRNEEDDFDEIYDVKNDNDINDTDLEINEEYVFNKQLMKKKH